MGVVMNFHEKYRHKKLDFERKALQDLSFQKIENVINETFEPYLKPMAAYLQTVTEMCVDYGIEAFLLGSSYGRFGFYGEAIEGVYQRSEKPFKMLLDDFYDFWLFWYTIDTMQNEDIYRACEAYLYYWWKEGFETALKRYRMRLH